LTIGLVPVAVAGFILNGYPQFETAPAIPWPLFAAGLVCVLAAGIGMFVWRARRVENFNPNDGDVEARRRDGLSRAVLVPETSPDGITTAVGPLVAGFSRRSNVTAVAGHAEPAATAPAGEPGRSTNGGADRGQEVAQGVLGCIGAIILIIGCVYYWKAESEREAKKDFERMERSMRQAEDRMMREQWRLPPPQPPPLPPLPQR
jgi:hypothetical protein